LNLRCARDAATRVCIAANGGFFRLRYDLPVRHLYFATILATATIVASPAIGQTKGKGKAAATAPGRPDTMASDDKRSDASSGSDKTGSDETGSDKTGSDKTGSDKTGSDKVVGTSATPASKATGASSAQTAETAHDAAAPTTASPTKPTAKVTESVSAAATYTQALNAFKYQDFDTAIPLFRKVLANPGALTRKRQWRAREFLGATLWFNGDKVGAADQFTGLLTQNPQGRLDPAYYPPQMIADFVRVRRKMIALGMIKPDDKPAPVTGEQAKYQAPPALLSYLPFGVGQIANDEIGEGVAFMVAESLLAATSLYFYDRNRRDAAQGHELSSGAKAGQLAPGIGFYVVAAWGVIDSIVARRKMNLPRVGTLPMDR
jgi:hypothetical protein